MDMTIPANLLIYFDRQNTLQNRVRKNMNQTNFSTAKPNYFVIDTAQKGAQKWPWMDLSWIHDRAHIQ